MGGIGNFIKRCQDIMRNDAGVNGDAQRIEQMTWALFLKVYDIWQSWAVDNKDGKMLDWRCLACFHQQHTIPPRLKVCRLQTKQALTNALCVQRLRTTTTT